MWIPFKKSIIKLFKSELNKAGINIGSNVIMTPSVERELNENYLYDFKLGYANDFNTSSLVWGSEMGDGDASKKEIKPIKVKIKPIQVLDELEKIVTPMSLTNLDDKIEILNDKADLLKQKYAKREVNELIARLEYRKQYIKHKKFFDGFQNTDQEKIDKLLEKYDLVMKSSEIFIPQFPDEAIKTMKSYTGKVKKITGKKPIFYVIAESSDFRKKDERLDPILLVQSPFGFFYQILGAWDKEMLLLSEL